MKSAVTIKMNFQQARRQADELEEIAGEMRRIAKNDLENSFQSLSAAWQGEAAEAYLRKGEQLRDKIIASAQQLEKNAGMIRSAAKRTYDAEMRAYNLAQTRLYNKK